MHEPEGDRPTDTPAYLDDTESPCDICGRLKTCEPCEHCSFSEQNAAALRTILADETKNPGELLAAARGLARSGDWAADAIVAGRVRWHLRRKFGADTVSALFDRPPADVDPLAGILTLDTIGSIEPAETRARGLLWSGKLGVLHGGAGCGKTTLAAGVVSAITAGLDWMGHGTTATDVLVLSGEDVDTLRARVDQWGGDPTRVHVWPDPDPGKVAEAVEATGAGAVVVDSLQSWARGLGLNLNDDAEAGTLVRGLSRVARDTGAAVLVLHHEPWAQNREKGSAAGDTAGRAKGSGEIVAAADYCLRCEADHNQGETTITPTKRRFGVDAERLVFLLDPGEGFTPAPDDGPRPDLTPTRRSTEDRILIHLARASVDASLTRKELSGALGIRNADVTGACSGLLDKGLLAAVKDGRRQGMALTDEGRIEGDRLIEGLTDKVQTRTVPDSGNRSRGLGTVPTVPVPLIGGEPGTVGGHAKGVGDMAEVVDGPWGADAPTVDDVQALAGAVKLEDWVGALPADVTKWTAADVERFRWAQRVQSGAPEGRWWTSIDRPPVAGRPHFVHLQRSRARIRRRMRRHSGRRWCALTGERAG